MLNCKSKSHNPDDIPYSFIQNMPSYAIIQLLKIYNEIWNNSIFPDQWHNAIVILIQKHNKNKFNLTNYRPILLINTQRK